MKYTIDCKKCGKIGNRGSQTLGLCRKCYRALPENRAKENLYSKRWYQLHRDSEIEKNKEYRRLNKELFNWYHDKDRFGGFKKQIIKRDNNHCVSCFAIDNLVIHHLDGTNYRRGNANNEIENLITLCNSCHSFLHRHQKRINKNLSREDIVQALAKAKEIFRNEYPLRQKERAAKLLK